jgi:hypothetical protein
MTTVVIVALLGLLGWGAEAGMHETHALALDMHQVSTGPVGDGVCPQ